MRVAMRAVSQPAANRYHLYVQVVVADVVAYLFQAAHDWEVGDGVDERYLARHCKPRREARHILLRYPGVQIAVGVPFGEGFEHRVAEIAANQPHPLVVLRYLAQRLQKSVSDRKSVV